MAEDPSPPSAVAKAGMALLLAAVLVVAVYGLTHASIRPVNPAQKPPKQHFGKAACAVCHTISAEAKLVQE
ncbi:MAG TPA: hypothetical protein VGK50_01120 [Coriobacteriia bacterium]|jgi:hypothetical protein